MWTCFLQFSKKILIKKTFFFEQGKILDLVKVCFVFVFASETHSMLTPLGSKRNSASAHGRSLITGSEFFSCIHTKSQLALLQFSIGKIDNLGIL